MIPFELARSIREMAWVRAGRADSKVPASRDFWTFFTVVLMCDFMLTFLSRRCLFCLARFKADG
jgi:hypothetical protein